MWFKNLRLYQFTDTFLSTPEEIQKALQEYRFSPCGNQETESFGWTFPLPGGELYYHAASGQILACLQKQERLLPSAVVNAKVAEKVELIEQDTGAPVSKKLQEELKDEIRAQLLPRAFTKDSFTFGFISPENDLLVVDAASDSKAEAFLAHLRKALGSLKVVPLARRSISADLTMWLKDAVPADIELAEEAELRELDEGGAIVRLKNQPLRSEEVTQHLDNGKQVFKIAVQWDETLNAVIQENLTISRLKFTDVVREQNSDIDKADKAARLDADFALMAGEIVRLAKRLDDIFQLSEE